MAKKKPKKKKFKLDASEIVGKDMGPGKTFNVVKDPKLADMLDKALKDLANLQSGHARPNWVATRCPNCNIKLNIPKAEATRCILCGNKELEISERLFLS